MEERNLVKSGKFSHTVALPKEWVDRHKLQKGSKVYFNENHGALFITPEKSQRSSIDKKEHILNVDGALPSGIVRDIIASYLTNISTIRLVGRDIKKNSSFYKETMTILPGLEVIEETGDYILIKDFINLDELVIPDLIRRADNIIRSLFLDTFDCLKSRDLNLAEAIRKRDKEVNRLSFLVYKGLNYITEHPNEGKLHGVDVSLIHHVWELNGYLEKIGDEVKRFAALIPKLKLSSKDLKEVELLMRDVERFYIDIMTALYKGNLDLADSSSNDRYSVKSKCNLYLEQSKPNLANRMVSKLTYLISFINSISRIARYISFEKHEIVKGQIVSTNFKLIPQEIHLL